MTPASWRVLPTDSWFLQRVNSTWILNLQYSNMLSTLGHSPGSILIVSLRRQDAFSTWSSSRKNTCREEREDFLRFGSVKKNPTDVKLWLEGVKKKTFEVWNAKLSHVLMDKSLGTSCSSLWDQLHRRRPHIRVQFCIIRITQSPELVSNKPPICRLGFKFDSGYAIWT